MSDTATLPPTDTNVNSPATAPVQNPAQGQPGASPGSGTPGGARPPTSGVPSQTSAEREVDLSATLEWAPGKAKTLKELIDTAERFERVQASGYELYERAVQGDQSAAREWLNKYGGLNTTQAQTTPNPVQQVQQTPQSQLPPEIQAKLAYIDQIQARDIRDGLKRNIDSGNFKALAFREDSVDLVIERLNQLYNQQVVITPQVVAGVMKQLNDNEQKVQDRLLKSVNAGNLGTNDPFRGGTPQILNEARPDPYKEPDKYKKWVGAQFARAAYADEAAVNG